MKWDFPKRFLEGVAFTLYRRVTKSSSTFSFTPITWSVLIFFFKVNGLLLMFYLFTLLTFSPSGLFFWHKRLISLIEVLQFPFSKKSSYLWQNLLHWYKWTVLSGQRCLAKVYGRKIRSEIPWISVGDDGQDRRGIWNTAWQY